MKNKKATKQRPVSDTRQSGYPRSERAQTSYLRKSDSKKSSSKAIKKDC